MGKGIFKFLRENEPLKNLFKRAIPEMETHTAKMTLLLATLHTAFVRVESVKLITKDFHFPALDYTNVFSSYLAMQTVK